MRPLPHTCTFDFLVLLESKQYKKGNILLLMASPFGSAQEYLTPGNIQLNSPIVPSLYLVEFAGGRKEKKIIASCYQYIYFPPLSPSLGCCACLVSSDFSLISKVQTAVA